MQEASRRLSADAEFTHKDKGEGGRGRKIELVPS